jgi:glycerol-3-phosphate dehydrogenase
VRARRARRHGNRQLDGHSQSRAIVVTLLVNRPETIDRLRGEGFDLLVIGGGIVGAGTAALAAYQGLKVALVERGDLASGTSSASSKLIHGGLRYLRLGDVRLVRQGLREARLLTRQVAPHLVRELPFLLPVERGGPYGPAAIRTALAAYGALTGSPRLRGLTVRPEQALTLVPPLVTARLRMVGVYRDAQGDDARLTLANVRAAAERGAAVVTRAEVVALERAEGGLAATVRDVLAGEVAVVRARAVVNATGAAVDDVRRLEDPGAGTSVTLSKGAHLVLERHERWAAALAIPIDRTRVAFAVPLEDLLLLGTTDRAFEPEADTLEVTAQEERQILAEAGRVLPPDVIRPEAIRFRFAGLRVLPQTGGPTAHARREVAFSRGPLGLLSVAGGKLTTYRRIARTVLASLRSDLGLHRLDELVALPGAGMADALAPPLRRRFPHLDPDLARHLTSTYGALAAEVLDACAEHPEALEPLAPGRPEVVAQARYARTHEWALEPEDVIRRRTTLAFHGLDSPALRARIEELWTSADLAQSPTPLEGR